MRRWIRCRSRWRRRRRKRRSRWAHQSWEEEEEVGRPGQRETAETLQDLRSSARRPGHHVNQTSCVPFRRQQRRQVVIVVIVVGRAKEDGEHSVQMISFVCDFPCDVVVVTDVTSLRRDVLVVTVVVVFVVH
eukprot:5747799-Pyramimonas_sp.AAC.1